MKSEGSDSLLKSFSAAAPFQVVVTTPYWALNGVNAFSADLVSGLLQQGITAHILLTDPDPFRKNPMPLPEDLPFQSLPVSPQDSRPKRLQALTRYLEERAPCIYLPNYDYAYSCVSPRLSRDVRIVGILHSDDPEHYEHARRLGRSWDGIVCVSGEIQKKLLAAEPRFRSKVKVIPYGVSVPDGFSARSPLKRPLKIIYAGRLNQYQKRIQDIYLIAREMEKRNIPCEWTLAGDGLERRSLERRFRGLALRGVKVFFPGTLPREELFRLFKTQDIFLLTAAFEGLPLAMLEAMAQGCVPLVSRIQSGVSEVIDEGENGFCVPVGNIPAFADRLEKLYGQPDLLCIMFAKARRTVESGYSRGRMAEDYKKYFTELQQAVDLEIVRSPKAKIAPPPVVPSDPARLFSFLKTGGLYVSHWMRKKLNLSIL